MDKNSKQLKYKALRRKQKLHDIEFVNDVLVMTPKTQAINMKIDKQTDSQNRLSAE